MSGGLFFSLTNYGIEVFGNVSGFTNDDNMRLHVLVNIVSRLISDEKSDTPVIKLHKKKAVISTPGNSHVQMSILYCLANEFT